MGDHSDGLSFGELGKNKTRAESEKLGVYTTCARPIRVGFGELDMGPGVLIRRFGGHIFAIVSEHRRGCGTMQRLGSLGLGEFQTLSDRLRNKSVSIADISVPTSPSRVQGRHRYRQVSHYRPPEVESPSELSSYLRSQTRTWLPVKLVIEPRDPFASRVNSNTIT